MTHTTPAHVLTRLLTRAAALMLLAAVAPGMARAGDAPANPHAMMVSDASRDGLEGACAVCHMPNDPESSDSPGWDTQGSDRHVTMYRSKTTRMDTARQPNAASMACLSCHDGTLAMDSMTQGPSHWARGAGSVGFDLSDDHPISLTYDPSDRQGFHSRAQVEAEGLRFFKGEHGTRDQLECGTCHDPHDIGSENFLRTTAGGSLCLTCHDK